jgi:hypothetical protein
MAKKPSPDKKKENRLMVSLPVVGIQILKKKELKKSTRK